MTTMIIYHNYHFINYSAAPVYSNRAGTSKTKSVSNVSKSTDHWALRAASKLLHVLLDFMQSLSLAIPAGHPEGSLKTCQS